MSLAIFIYQIFKIEMMKHFQSALLEKISFSGQNENKLFFVSISHSALLLSFFALFSFSLPFSSAAFLRSRKLKSLSMFTCQEENDQNEFNNNE